MAISKRTAIVAMTMHAAAAAAAEGNLVAARDVVSAPEVTVSATRTERNVEEVPATVDIITREEIESAIVQDTGDLFRYEPGVSVPSDPERFGGTGINIRGLTENRVQVQVDGIPMPDYFRFSIGPFNTVPRTFIDVDSLERVEVLRGPASSLYGSDALGGVVTYITKDPDDYLAGRDRPWYASYKAGYATADESWTNTFTGALGNDTIQALAVVTFRDGHEQETHGSDDSIGPNRTEANPQDNAIRNALLKFVVKPAAGQLVRLTYERYASEVETDVLSLNYATPKTTVLTGDDQFDRQRASIDYEYTGESNLLASARLRLYWQNSESDEQSFETRAATTAGCSGSFTGINTCNIDRLFTFEQSVIGATAQAESRATLGSSAHRFVYGVDVSRTETEELRDATIYNLTTSTVSKSLAGDTFPVRDFPRSKTQRLGLFVQDEIAWLDGRLETTLGVRYDRYELDVRPDDIYLSNTPPGIQASDFEDSAVSPKVGALWHLTPATAVYANVATGFRAPPYDDVNSSFRDAIQQYAIIPTPDLKSEKSVGTELGVRGRYARSSFSIVGFYNRYKDFIDSSARLNCPSDPSCVPGFAFTFQSVNRARVRIWGAEARGAYNFAQGWNVDGAIAFARGDDLDTDQPLNTVDPLKAVVGLRYDHDIDRWGAAATLTAVARKTRIDSSQMSQPPHFETPGFAIVDFTAYWRPVNAVTIRAGVFNVFDTKYWLWSDVYLSGIGPNTTPPGSPPFASIDRYTQPGRNASVSVKVEF